MEQPRLKSKVGRLRPAHCTGRVGRLLTKLFSRVALVVTLGVRSNRWRSQLARLVNGSPSPQRSRSNRAAAGRSSCGKSASIRARVSVLSGTILPSLNLFLAVFTRQLIMRGESFGLKCSHENILFFALLCSETIVHQVARRAPICPWLDRGILCGAVVNESDFGQEPKRSHVCSQGFGCDAIKGQPDFETLPFSRRAAPFFATSRFR
jgi:hypothetical protein